MDPQAVEILADENVSPRIVAFLREKGLNVSDVKEKGWHGVDDKFLLGFASTEKRFILTHDGDFGTLAINEGVPCYGIIYLRIKDLKFENVKRVLSKFLKTKMDLEEGNIIIVQEKQLRIRKIVRRG